MAQPGVPTACLDFRAGVYSSNIHASSRYIECRFGDKLGGGGGGGGKGDQTIIS